MRDVLEALAAGELTPEEAEIALRGYLTGDVGRFDAAREERRGIPEGILAAGKTPEEVAAFAVTAVRATDHALVTRTTEAHRTAVSDKIASDVPDATVSLHERARVVVVRTADYNPPTLDAQVGVVSAGTADAQAAGEAALVLEELGVDTERIEDVGVANLTRITDQLPRLREFDVLIVAAGREGALPTVVAGLVDVPVIGLPVSSGYGYGGDGEAALLGMLQSCTTLSVVNIDAGFVAGAQAGLIAQQLNDARSKE